MTLSDARLPTALVGLALAFLIGCTEDPNRIVLEPRGGSPVAVTVELATTPESRQLGLMYRSELGPERGMLFVFPEKEPRSFWMRNTKIPLDILYVEDDGTIVNVHERTTPFSEKSLPSAAPVRFVLEVEGGFCEKHGVRAGDRVRLGDLARAPRT